MHIIFLCLRYLSKRRIALVATAVVTLCVALLIVVTSLFRGFIDEYLKHSGRHWGQIVCLPEHQMANYDELTEYLEKLDCVATATAVAQTGGLLYLRKGDVRGVQIVGIDLADRCRDEHFKKGLLLQNDNRKTPSFELSTESKDRAAKWLQQRTGGRKEPAESHIKGMILGIAIMTEPDEKTDQYDRDAVAGELIDRYEPMILITASNTAGGPDGFKKKQIVAWPVDAVDTGMYIRDKGIVYLPFEAVAELIGRTDEKGKLLCRAAVQINTKENVDPKIAMGRIRSAWNEFLEGNDRPSIYLSQELPWVKTFTNEIYKQLAIMQLILGLICLVAALLMFVILMMIVAQKQRDIGVVRSVGGSRKSAAAIFLAFGAVVGAIGSAMGSLLGIVVTDNINTIEAWLSGMLGFKIWKSGVYLYSRIPNQVAWSELAWIVAAGITAATLGAVLPAIKAARSQPAEVLRYE